MATLESTAVEYSKSNGPKADKIFEHANEQHIRAVRVYVSSSKAYVDAAFTTQFTTTQLENAFLKGCVIVDTAKFYMPTAFEVTSGVGTITYATGTTPTMKTAVSVAD